MPITFNTAVKENRGKPRVWLQGSKLLKSGIDVGDRYDVNLSSNEIALSFSNEGKYVVSRKKVVKQDRYEPVIDLNSNAIMSMFDVGDMIEIRIREDEVVITAHQLAARQNVREERLKNHIRFQKTVNVASLFSGCGVLDNALHEGLLSKGIKSCVKIVVEKSDVFFDALISNSGHLFDETTKFFNSEIQFASSDGSNSIDIVTAGIPCTAASSQGRAKHRYERPEQCRKAGAMFFYTLEMIRKLNPSYVIIENVPSYKNTASWDTIKNVLDDNGYNLEVATWSGNEFGALENRKRLIAVASSKGLPRLNLNAVVPEKSLNHNVSEILEDIPLDDERWKNREGMKRRVEKNKEEGRNFKRSLISIDDKKVNTIAANYGRNSLTNPYLMHPNDPSIDRQFTVVEHARMKGIPSRVVDGLAMVNAHSALGQSVVWNWFRCIGRDLGVDISDL